MSMRRMFSVSAVLDGEGFWNRIRYVTVLFY